VSIVEELDDTSKTSDPSGPALNPPPAPVAPVAPVVGPGRGIKFLKALALAALGWGVLVVAWQLLTMLRPELPTPHQTYAEVKTLLASPFHDKGPNDKGLFLQLGSSLVKVFGGFLAAAVVGIPFGFAIGASKTAWRIFNPVIQVLRPVSPLAWFPLALVLFKNGAYASVLTIGITALWPTLINTAAGVGSIPQDHRNVARVFRFSRFKYVRHIMLPYSMGPIITGLRLSMGIGWMVIVATEMLSGGTGIGFFVWDSYNNGNLAAVAAAIIFIGLIGFAFDAGFSRLAAKFDYAATAQ